MAPTKRLMEFLTARSSAMQLKKTPAPVPEDPDSSESSGSVGFTGLFFRSVLGLKFTAPLMLKLNPQHVFWWPYG
jgi:hypothetical protein